MTKYPNATPSRKNSRRGLVLVAAATTIAVVGGIVNNSACCVHAFQPAGRSSWSSDGGVIATTRFRTRDNPAVTQLQVVPPDLFTGGGGGVSTAVVPDLHDVATHVQAVQGYVQTTWEHGVPAAHTMWLSQAAATATEGFDLDTFEETQAAILKDKGWWEAYLNIFKTWIEVIHTTIDAPIHKYTGWQGGTWGFSIALFTASTFVQFVVSLYSCFFFVYWIYILVLYYVLYCTIFCNEWIYSWKHLIPISFQYHLIHKNETELIRRCFYKNHHNGN